MIRKKIKQGQPALTRKEYDDILKQQDYRCAICNVHYTQLKKRLAVDHNHSTGIIRGLLCYKCNVGLGLFNDDGRILDIAKLYLNRKPPETERNRQGELIINSDIFKQIHLKVVAERTKKRIEEYNAFIYNKRED